MPEFKDIAKLSPLPIVNLRDIQAPTDGLLVAAAKSCGNNFAKDGKCAEHYALLKTTTASPGTLHQCPYGFASVVVRTKGSDLALTGIVPFPRLGGDAERELARRHKDHKLASTAMIQAANGVKATILHFESLENESVKKYSVALHEIRKLNAKVKQTAERLCRDDSETDPDDADPELVQIWKSAELMSQQFDAIELLANEGLAQLPLRSPIEVYRIFHKCIRIYTPTEEPHRIQISSAPSGYSGPIMACDKTFSIIPSVLIENALKYSLPKSPVIVSVRKGKETCSVTVTNRTKLNPALTGKVFEKGVRATVDTSGTGNGLYLARLVVLQHKGTIGISTRAITGDQIECTITVRLPESDPVWPSF